ncbi:MAG: hypothetical protein COA67_07355 [Lutibacter sp.]|nr:MAG: hypothetical protein COA67_07355 [Lutibacter sp.]
MIFGNKLIDFFKNKKITNKTLSQQIGYSESMVGRYLKNPNLKFIVSILEHYPSIDLNYLFKENIKLDSFDEEGTTVYGEDNGQLIHNIESSLLKLKKNLSQK